MTDEIRGAGGEDLEAQGAAEPMNWACTACGYRIEGDLPEKCPDCGADRREFDPVPVPGF